MDLKGKRIVVCATGSVAAIETPKLARELRRKGAEVYCVMSRSAQRIIHPDVLEWASEHEVVTQLDGRCQHVRLCGLVPDKADLVLIAPCTANTLGKIAAGIDDTTVTTVVSTAIGTGIPVVIVPAMHYSLYRHPLSQENIAKLSSLGVRFVQPRLEENKAKFPGIEEVLLELQSLIEAQPAEKDFAGKRVIVTAGATQEPIDEVRFISNRSSGLMGFALAETATERGAEVILVKGNTSARLPESFAGKVIEAPTAAKMLAVIKEEAKQADIIVHAAAVADFLPARQTGKIDSGQASLLELKPAVAALRDLNEKLLDTNTRILMRLGGGEKK